MKSHFTRNAETRCLAHPKIKMSFPGKQWYLLLLAITAFSFGVSAQIKVTGTVKDDAGIALQGVSVSVKGTAIGAGTNEQGQYTIVCPDPQGTLVFTYIGFTREEVLLNGRSVVNVGLLPDNKALNEVVVTGYSAQKKKDITGSVAVVEMKALKSIPAGSAMQALQGQASGVNVVSTGVPGAASKINIRGVSTFGSTNPLVLVDGVQTDLNNVSADDIESMQVLKDAGAAAIYGVRGANGVIIITTKKGKTGAPVLTYDSYFGLQFPFSGDPLNQLNSTDFARLTKQAFPGTKLFANGLSDFVYGGPGGTGTGMTGDPAVDPAKYNLDPANSANNYLIQQVNKTGTDWYHAMFKRAPVTSHNVTVSGGTDKSNYLFSLGYLNQQGSVIETYLKRYSARINTSYKLKENIRIGENAYVFYKQSPGFSNQGEFSPMANLYKMMPIVPVYDIRGNYGGTFAGPELGSDANPVATQYRKKNNRANEWDIVGNVYAEVDFLKNFTARTSFGGTISNLYSQNFNFVAYNDKQGYNSPNSYSEGASYNSSSMWTNTLTYKNTFKKHQVNVLAGSEAIRNYGRGVGGGAQKFFSTEFDYLILNNGTANVTNYSNAYINTLFSLFGRLDYTFDDKYLLGVTVRRDGSSRFGSEKRYGVFPSVSLGWRLSQEGFMKHLDWINDLKIRASYGILGSENSVSPENAYSLYGGSYNNAYYDINGSSNSVQQGFFQTRIGNPRTSWEQDIITNVGFDATVLNNKLDFSVEYYKKTIKGLLFSQDLPATVGGATPPTVNVGDIQNTGFDISVGFRQPITKDLQFTVRANITTYQNTVMDIPGTGYFDAGSQQQLGNMVRNQEGHPVSAFYGYEVMHLFRDDDEVNKAPTQTGAAPGRFRYSDVNGDGKIDAADRTFLGNPNPDFTYGVNLGINYKGFDLSAIFYGSQGNEVVNALKVNTHFFGTYVGGKSKDLLDAWTPENTGATIPKVESANNFSTSGVLNSFFVEDGSYLRLRSLSLGYTLNPAVLQRIRMERLRIYCQATNLFTITKYSGLDPELGGSSASFGIDYGNYPNNQKTVLVGINLSF
ncbi:TonB-dependent receptor [Chitinophaga sp. MM2321]|uniref:SusC/RagA family TonB-linked outer membrane protein n=1 Tax=Chitinophaga sp. MM2321 TaxID=3137178 RepID=UPI0032D582BF